MTLSRKLLCTILWALAGPAIAGCGSGRHDAFWDLPPELRQSETVCVFSPHARIPRTGTYAWLTDSLGSLGDPRFNSDDGNFMLQDSIQKALEAKGYTLDSPKLSDLLVGYYVAVDHPVDDETLNHRYGFGAGWTPGSGSARNYKRGTLIIDIVQNRTRRPLWRGALQANVDPELSDEVRKQRLDLAAAQLLSSFSPR